MYLLSAYFDEKSNRILQRHIQSIAEGTGNHFMTENHVPPHLTITAIESRDAGVLLESFMEPLSEAAQGRIQIVSIGALFPYVLYATPIRNQYLEALSQNIYQTIAPLLLESAENPNGEIKNKIKVNKYYLPMQWFPHITLGKKLEEGQMQAAFQIMQKKFAPLEATIQSIGLARTNPHEDIYTWLLKGD